MAFYINRLQNIETVEYECEVITPLFLGGAEEGSAELRPASVKGALRFWWRAVYGHTFDSIEEMYSKESEIFGSTENKSAFSISIIDQNITISDTPDKKGIRTFSVHGHSLSIMDYLCYGVCQYDRDVKGNVYKVKSINPGSKFKMKFDFYNTENKEEVITALYCLSKYGGLGAKSRNGLGSIYISNLKDIGLGKINELSQQSFTSFSGESKLFNKFKEHQTWQQAFSDIGLAYHKARTTIEGHYEYNFRKRISQPMMGMPKPQTRPVDFSDLKDKRHAKPYFLNVSKTDNGKYQGKIICLPYNYLAGSNENRINEKKQEYNNAIKKMNEKLNSIFSNGGN